MEATSSRSRTRPSLLLRVRDPADAASWRTFVDVYGPLVYRHCRRRGLQDADAAEVTQEVLLQVSRSIRRFDYRPEHGRFRDWLGTLTRNQVYRFFKRRPAEATLDFLEPAEEDRTWAEAFNRHLLHTALARARPHFAGPTWRAFELTWLENRRAAEAAGELGQTLDWVYVAKSRVLKRLRQEVQELAEDSDLFAR